MDANTVHTIARSLPAEELQRLYDFIGKDLINTKSKTKFKKEKIPIISNLEAKNMLLEKVFNVTIKKS